MLESRIGQLAASGDQDDLVRAAMAAPIHSAPLHELARGKQTCTIIISDHTRPVPSKHIIPFMLEELRRDSPDIQITLLVATGFYRPTSTLELVDKLGQDIVDRERIVIHDSRDASSNVKIGVLPSGADCVIDRLAVETDLLVAEGFIEPHFFAGFSGGRKSVLPGVCDQVTVLGNHCSKFIASPYARTGVLEGNPLHVDMLAAAKMAKLAYIVNVVIDEDKKVAAAAEGAMLIMFSSCSDGHGGESFYRTLHECQSPEELTERILATPQEKTLPDQWEFQILARVLYKHHVIYVTDPAQRSTIEDMKLEWAPDVDEALAHARKIKGGEAHLVVIPNGISVMVR